MQTGIATNWRKWIALIVAVLIYYLIHEGSRLFGIPEILLRVLYGIIGAVNLIIFIKTVYPKYKKAFRETSAANALEAD